MKTRSKRNCRRPFVTKGNSKLVESSVKEILSNGRSKFGNMNVTLLSDRSEEKDSSSDLNILWDEEKENCDSVAVDQRDESENEPDSVQSNASSGALFSEENSSVSLRPRLSLYENNGAETDNGKLARRLFKTYADVTSRVIAPPQTGIVSKNDNEIDAKKPWKSFESPWDFGLPSMSFDSDERMTQTYTCSWIDSHHIDETREDITDNLKTFQNNTINGSIGSSKFYQKPTASLHENTFANSDALVGLSLINKLHVDVFNDLCVEGSLKTVVYCYNPYLPPTFQGTGCKDLSSYPYPRNDFFLQRSHGGSYHSCPYIQMPCYQSK